MADCESVQLSTTRYTPFTSFGKWTCMAGRFVGNPTPQCVLKGSDLELELKTSALTTVKKITPVVAAQTSLPNVFQFGTSSQLAEAVAHGWTEALRGSLLSSAEKDVTVLVECIRIVSDEEIVVCGSLCTADPIRHCPGEDSSSSRLLSETNVISSSRILLHWAVSASVENIFAVFSSNSTIPFSSRLGRSMEKAGVNAGLSLVPDASALLEAESVVDLSTATLGTREIIAAQPDLSMTTTSSTTSTGFFPVLDSETLNRELYSLLSVVAWTVIFLQLGLALLWLLHRNDLLPRWVLSLGRLSLGKTTDALVWARSPKKARAAVDTPFADDISIVDVELVEKAPLKRSLFPPIDVAEQLELDVVFQASASPESMFAGSPDMGEREEKRRLQELWRKPLSPVKAARRLGVKGRGEINFSVQPKEVTIPDMGEEVPHNRPSFGKLPKPGSRKRGETAYSVEK